jgi:hypothetical protein
MSKQRAKVNTWYSNRTYKGFWLPANTARWKRVRGPQHIHARYARIWENFLFWFMLGSSGEKIMISMHVGDQRGRIYIWFHKSLQIVCKCVFLSTSKLVQPHCWARRTFTSFALLKVADPFYLDSIVCEKSHHESRRKVSERAVGLPVRYLHECMVAFLARK